MGLPHTWRAQQQHVGGPFHDRNYGWVLDHLPVNAGLSIKIELLEGLATGEVGQPGAGFDVPFVPGGQLLFHQGVQVVQIAHVGAGGFLSTMDSDLGHVI